jgi:hypothetical protein
MVPLTSPVSARDLQQGRDADIAGGAAEDENMAAA